MSEDNILRRCVARFPSGVCVFTAKKDDMFFGMTFSSFSLVSLDPPMVSFNLNLKYSRINHFNVNTNFIINILSEEQANLAGMFYRYKTQDFPLKEEQDYFLYEELPVFKNAVCFFHCRVANIYNGGGSQMILSHAKHCEILSDKKPLIVFRGKFSELLIKND